MSLGKSMFFTTTLQETVYASGGIETTNGKYKIHTFTSPGNFIVYLPIDVSVLLNGKGGAGGNRYTSPPGINAGGGGGAGGTVRQYTMSLSPNTYPVGLTTDATFHGQTATAGGGGANATSGKGGIGGSNADYFRSLNNGTTGGSGAGAGGNASGGTGGPGVASTITGVSVVYGKGGNGGTSFKNGQAGDGGIVIIKYKFK